MNSVKKPLILPSKQATRKEDASTKQDSDRIRLLTNAPLTVALLGPRLLHSINHDERAVMNEVRKPEFAEAISSLAGFAQISSDATRRLCEQGQSAVKTISERNTEVSRFLSHRVAQNGETLGRMTKCQNFPEVFAIQAQWVREAADDYLKEMSKLMEANSRIMSGMLRSVG
jgi:Phasin protein